MTASVSLTFKVYYCQVYDWQYRFHLQHDRDQFCF